MCEIKLMQTALERWREGLAQLEGQYRYRYPFLAGHAKFLAARASVRGKWPGAGHMRTIYLLLAENIGEASWNEHLRFPTSWRTIQNWRHKEWSKPSLTKDLLNIAKRNSGKPLRVLNILTQYLHAYMITDPAPGVPYDVVWDHEVTGESRTRYWLIVCIASRHRRHVLQLSGDGSCNGLKIKDLVSDLILDSSFLR
jgi:hypothetical protein